MTVVPSAIVDAIVDAVPMVTKVKPTPVTVLFVIATPVTLTELPIETPEELFMGWQFTRDTLDEEQKSYQEAPNAFEQAWGTDIPNKEETIKEEGGLVKESSIQKFRSVQVSNFSEYLSKLNWK